MIAYEMEWYGSSQAAGVDFNTLENPEQDTVKARSRLAYVSTLYIENSNQERYGDLKTQLANYYTLYTSNFPHIWMDLKICTLCKLHQGGRYQDRE